MKDSTDNGKTAMVQHHLLAVEGENSEYLNSYRHSYLFRHARNMNEALTQ